MGVGKSVVIVVRDVNHQKGIDLKKIHRLVELQVLGSNSKGSLQSNKTPVFNNIFNKVSENYCPLCHGEFDFRMFASELKEEQDYEFLLINIQFPYLMILQSFPTHFKAFYSSAKLK